ncbi:MAG: hypothetical protein Q4D61_01860 [Cardiobacteriaceae bacterium]|nr:hypothetical protein [Cardiobacteriaceae bacterium]
MKRHALLILLATLLTACTALRDISGYRFPYLRQLVGQHISIVTSRLDGVQVSDEKFLGGREYFLSTHNEYSHTINTYNYYGAIIDQQHIYNRGKISFITDSNGYITRYVETGYIPVQGGNFDMEMRSAFRDIVVFEN